MKKVLHNQLVDQYSAYNLEYEELCNYQGEPDLDGITYIAGKCDALYKILSLVDVRLTTLIKYLKVAKNLCERDYKKAMEHYNDELEYEYLNRPTYYKGCIEIYTDVINKLSKDLTKDVCL